MGKQLRACRRLRRHEAGVTSIEYALLGALIAVAIAASVSLLGERVNTLYEDIQEQVSQALP